MRGLKHRTDWPARRHPLLLAMLLGGALTTACISAGNRPDRPATPNSDSLSEIPVMAYFEIPISDMDRAVAFYSSVLGLTLTRETVDGYDMATFGGPADGSGASGALAKGDVYFPSKSGPILYFRVNSIDAVLARATAAGASILYPKKDIGAVGYVAEIEDSEGNRIALTEPKP